jgi:hypothetical protein
MGTERGERPQRIQRKRMKGWKMPPNTVYVGRPSKWGNPFKTADEYRRYLRSDHHWQLPAIETLRGKNLACWCPLDQPCHADVLLEIANA